MSSAADTYGELLSLTHLLHDILVLDLLVRTFIFWSVDIVYDRCVHLGCLVVFVHFDIQLQLW